MTADDIEPIVDALAPGARVTPVLNGWLLELGGCSVMLSRAEGTPDGVADGCRRLGAMAAKDAQAGAEAAWRASVERRLAALERARE